MRNFKFIYILCITLGTLAIYSCHADLKDSINIEHNRNSNVDSRSVSNYLKYKIGQNYTIYFNEMTKRFYLVQQTLPGNLNNNYSFISYQAGKLVLKDETLNQINTYELNTNGVYGIATMKGIESIVFTPDMDWIDDDILAKLYCKCRKNGESPKPCTSGGEGATECSQTIKAGPIVEQDCTVKCGEGHYACCWAD